MKPENHTVDIQSLKREDGIMQTDEEDEEEEATKTIQPPVTVRLLLNSLIYLCLSVCLSINLLYLSSARSNATHW